MAKVGSATLTRDQLTRMHHTGTDSTLDPRRYVNDWVVTELLYREAERRGIAGSDAVNEQAEQARRHLAVAALLEQEIYADTTGVTDSAVAAFYHQNSASFLLGEEVINLSYVAFSERDAANAFRSRVLGGTKWETAVDRLRSDTTGRSALVQLADHQYFTRGRLYPQELWKLATTLPRGDVSFVLKTDAGFYVLTVHSVIRQGSVPDLGYVRDDIRNRLLIEHRRERYEKLLDQLRLKTEVDVRMENAGRTNE